VEPIGETIFQNMIQAPNLAQILLGAYFFWKNMLATINSRWRPFFQDGRHSGI